MDLIELVAKRVEIGVEVEGHGAQQAKVEHGVGKLQRIDRPVHDADALVPCLLALHPLEQIADVASAIVGQHAHGLGLDAHVAVEAFLPIDRQARSAEFVHAVEEAGGSPSARAISEVARPKSTLCMSVG